MEEIGALYGHHGRAMPAHIAVLSMEEVWAPLHGRIGAPWTTMHAWNRFLYCVILFYSAPSACMILINTTCSDSTVPASSTYKVVLVGDCGVGKSSILLQFVVSGTNRSMRHTRPSNRMENLAPKVLPKL